MPDDAGSVSEVSQLVLAQGTPVGRIGCAVEAELDIGPELACPANSCDALHAAFRGGHAGDDGHSDRRRGRLGRGRKCSRVEAGAAAYCVVGSGLSQSKLRWIFAVLE